MLLALAWQFNEAIVLFILSLAVAAAFRPLINALNGRGVPRSLALVLSYGVGLTFLSATLIAISKPMVMDVQGLTDNVLDSYERVRGQWVDSSTPFYQGLAAQLPPTEALYEAISEERRNQLAEAIFGVAEGVISFGGRVAVIIILSIYWTADQVRFERLWLSILPVDRRSTARKIWREIEEGVGAHLGSEILQSILAVLLLWIGYSALGLEYAALLSASGALIRLIPWFGAVLAVIPPLLVGLGHSSWAGLGAATFTLTILLLLGLVLEPRLFPRRQYNSILLVVIVFALAESFGILGVILAPPLTVAIQILFGQILQPQNATENIVLAGRITDLKSQLAEINTKVGETQIQLPQETLSLTERLTKLADKTKAFLETSGD
jgi:predicted PurR-regulated permease PerM